MKFLLSTILFLLFIFCVCAQDKIKMKSGAEIDVEILRIDDTYIYYRTKSGSENKVRKDVLESWSYANEFPTDDFEIVEGLLVYQKVFNEEFDVTYLLNVVDLERISANRITGNLKGRIPGLNYGLSNANYPLMFNNTLWGKVVVETKEGKYRVIVRDIIWGSDFVGLFKHRLEDFALTKSGTIKRNKQKHLSIINMWFNDLFKPKVIGEDDW